MKSGNNFLVFELCDNDYGYDLYRAVTYAIKNDFYETAGEDCLWWKNFVIQFVLAAKFLKGPQTKDGLHATEKYLQTMRVYATRHWPTLPNGKAIDHDGGSIVLDINQKSAYFI